MYTTHLPKNKKNVKTFKRRVERRKYLQLNTCFVLNGILQMQGPLPPHWGVAPRPLFSARTALKKGTTSLRSVVNKELYFLIQIIKALVWFLWILRCLFIFTKRVKNIQFGFRICTVVLRAERVISCKMTDRGVIIFISLPFQSAEFHSSLVPCLRLLFPQMSQQTGLVNFCHHVFHHSIPVFTGPVGKNFWMLINLRW